MSNTNKDGGPAFPVLAYEYKASGDLHPSPTIQDGMSLRDWFAGMALQGLLAMCAGEHINSGDNEAVAKVAYMHAEAMLKERLK